MFKSVSTILFAVFAMASTASASVFLGGVSDVKNSPFCTQRSSCQVTDLYRSKSFESENKRQQMARMVRRQVNPTTKGAAMAIPGYGVAEQVFVGGFANFLSIYNIVITGRVLLSWFPQAQGIGVLQPIFQITDPYLNLFRGLIPPIFGLDLSPILAFVLLNVLTNVTAAVGAEIKPDDKKKLYAASPFGVKPYHVKK
mmetsp:Transcript_7823/g.19165  ORF Transcript_7823/g.19165 Transcript_7823/m.19165 type:complete len:198 (+) Transcript_7823:100-693(+)